MISPSVRFGVWTPGFGFLSLSFNSIGDTFLPVAEKEKIELPGLTLSFKLDMPETTELSPRRSPDGKESKFQLRKVKCCIFKILLSCFFSVCGAIFRAGMGINFKLNLENPLGKASHQNVKILEIIWLACFFSTGVPVLYCCGLDQVLMDGYVISVSSPLGSGWRRPHLSQRRTRERIRSVLSICAPNYEFLDGQLQVQRIFSWLRPAMLLHCTSSKTFFVLFCSIVLDRSLYSKP